MASELYSERSSVAEDERSEKSQFGLAVKVKRQSSQCAQLSASFLTNIFCVYRNVQIFININAQELACIKLMGNHHIAFAASASRHVFTIWKVGCAKVRVLSSA